jgi:glycerol-3-phosphate O-acyltransferase
MATRGEAHDGAARRQRAAIAEQDRLTYLYEEAIGTSAEVTADAARRGSDEQVRARDAWLKWVHEDNYQGLNAGPMPVRRELDD